MGSRERSSISLAVEIAKTRRAVCSALEEAAVGKAVGLAEGLSVVSAAGRAEKSESVAGSGRRVRSERSERGCFMG